MLIPAMILIGTSAIKFVYELVAMMRCNPCRVFWPGIVMLPEHEPLASQLMLPRAFVFVLSRYMDALSYTPKPCPVKETLVKAATLPTDEEIMGMMVSVVPAVIWLVFPNASTR